MAENIRISVIGDKSNKQNDAVALDEAMEQAKIGKYQRLLIALTGLCIMGTVSENISISYILPQLKCDLNMSTAEQGILSSVSYIGIVVSSHLWGFLADTWGRQKVLRSATLGGFITCFASAFSWNTWSMILLRFLGGVFLSGGQAAGYSYISEFHTTKTAASAAGFVTAFLPACFLHMSLLAILILPMDWQFDLYLIEMKPWRLFIIAISMLNLWNCTLYSFLPETPKFLLAKGRKDEALQVLRKIYAVNTGQPKKSFPVKQLESVDLGNSLSNVKGFCSILKLLWSQTKPIFQAPLLTNTVKFSWILFVLFCVGHGTYMWFPGFVIQMKSFKGEASTLCQIVQPSKSLNSTIDVCLVDNKDTYVYVMMIGMGCVYIVLAAISSYTIRHINPKKIVFGWLLVTSSAAISINYWTDIDFSIISFIIFLSSATCASQVMAVSVNLFPTNYRSMATSFIVTCGRLGGAFGSNAVGFLLEGHCSKIFYIAAGALISSVFVFMTVKSNKQVVETRTCNSTENK